jgi:hypothetical protein
MLNKQVRLQWYKHCCRAFKMLKGVVLLAGTRIQALASQTGEGSGGVLECGQVRLVSMHSLVVFFRMLNEQVRLRVFSVLMFIYCSMSC